MKSISRDEQLLLFHPKNIMLIVLMFGLSMLFVALTIAYAYTRVTMKTAPVNVPPLFLLNTVVLLASSYTMILAKKAYQNDDTAAYQQHLLSTVGLSAVFVSLQVATWYWLFQINALTLQSSNGVGYLYVISLMHLLHVLAGLPFLLLFWQKARKCMKEPVTVLVYFSDPEKRLKLRLLTLYWHFLDILWIYLVLFLGLLSVL